MIRVARTAAAVALAAMLLLAAAGWLYVLRPHDSLPGPAVRDALPLDELSRHGSVSVTLYLLVWGGAAALLGLLTRWARVERLTAGLLLALATGGWLYAVNGISILVVRQTDGSIAARYAARSSASNSLPVRAACAASWRAISPR